MKSVRSIAALAILSTLAFTSCKKDYTCTCVNTEAGASTTTVYEKAMRNRTKVNAEETCRRFEADMNQLKPGNTKCKL